MELHHLNGIHLSAVILHLLHLLGLSQASPVPQHLISVQLIWLCPGQRCRGEKTKKKQQLGGKNNNSMGIFITFLNISKHLYRVSLHAGLS